MSMKSTNRAELSTGARRSRTSTEHAYLRQELQALTSS